MNAPVRYITETSTAVTLPSGLVAYLRPIPAEVWLARLGRIPGAFMNTVAAQNSQTRQAEAAAFVRDNPDFAVKLATALLCSVVAIEFKGDAESVAIVDKPQTECGAHELALASLLPADIEAITTAALDLNGLSTEAAERHRPTFRGEGLALFFGLLGASLRAESLDDAQHVGAGSGVAVGDGAGSGGNGSESAAH